jgi:hypothetical protein
MARDEPQSPLWVISWVIFHHPSGQNALDIASIICFYAKTRPLLEKTAKIADKKQLLNVWTNCKYLIYNNVNSTF